MRFLLSTTLALGLALAGSVAYAQATLEGEQPDSDVGVDECEGLECPEQPSEQRQFGEPESQPSTQAPDRSESGYIESEEQKAPDVKIEEKESIESERETGAYGPYMTPKAEEQEQQDKMGFEVLAGGGIFNYSDSDARDVTSLGATYTARVGVGTNRPVALEIAYIGTAQATEALGLDTSANLISNGVEGVARVNLMTGAFRPYVVGGAAWKRYDLINEDFNTSAIRDQDDVVEFPVGLGMAYHFNKFVLDARGNYRFAADEELIRGVEDAGLDNWDVTLKAGVEF